MYATCSSANGCTSDAAVISSIWSCFAGCRFTRKDGVALAYYKSFTNDASTVRRLLETADGKCGAWADLLRFSLLAQGIDSVKTVLYPLRCNGVNNGVNGFAVKTWTFDGNGTSGDVIFPYLNKANIPLVRDAGYNWGDIHEVNYDTGVRGQNNERPASLFQNHVVIWKGGMYYDPSYGLTYSDLVDFEANLSGFYKDIINSDGRSILFQKNPEGLQIDENNPYDGFLSY